MLLTCEWNRNWRLDMSVENFGYFSLPVNRPIGQSKMLKFWLTSPSAPDVTRLVASYTGWFKLVYIIHRTSQTSGISCRFWQLSEWQRTRNKRESFSRPALTLACPLLKPLSPFVKKGKTAARMERREGKRQKRRPFSSSQSPSRAFPLPISFRG